MRLEFIERGRVEYMELENKCFYIKEEKINLTKMKEERERKKEERERMKEEREIMTMNVDALPLMQQEYLRKRQLEILGRRSGN